MCQRYIDVLQSELQYSSAIFVLLVVVLLLLLLVLPSSTTYWTPGARSAPSSSRKLGSRKEDEQRLRLESNVAPPRRPLLEDELANGIAFSGVSGILDMSGAPWLPRIGNFDYLLSTVEKDHHVKNVVTFKEVGEVTPDLLDSLNWPGGYEPTPPSVLSNSACYKRLQADPTFTCNHGQCLNEARAGNAAGSCQCFAGHSGRFCTYSTRRDGSMEVALRRSVNKPLQVGMVMELYKFDGFTTDGNSVRGGIRIRLTYTDPCAMVQDGVYKLSQAISLNAGGQIWVPSVQIPNCKVGALVGTVKLAYPEVTVLMELPVDDCKVQVGWQFFPFDDQEASFTIVPDDVSQYIFISAPPTVSHENLGVPTSVVEDNWTHMWPLRRSVMEIESHSATITVEVTRNPTILLIRVVIPLVLLTVISWAGFYIRVAALMPRFASGFISFLALNSFKSTVTSAMHTTMASVSWFEIALSIATFMMAFAVLENVTAEFINFGRGELVARTLDCFARIAFPCYFVLMLLILVLGVGKNNPFGMTALQLFVITHVIVAVFMIHMTSFAILICTFYRHLLLTLGIEHARADGVDAILGDKELKLLYEAFERESRVKTDEQGILIRDADCVYEWMMVFLGDELPKQEKEQLKEVNSGGMFVRESGAVCWGMWGEISL